MTAESMGMVVGVPDEMENVDPTQFETVEWDEILKAKRLDFIVGTEQLKKILTLVGNDVDGEGYITEDGKRVLAIDEGEVKPAHIGAVLPGSKVFIKKNVAGFSQYLFDKRDR